MAISDKPFRLFNNLKDCTAELFPFGETSHHVMSVDLWSDIIAMEYLSPRILVTNY